MHFKILGMWNKAEVVSKSFPILGILIAMATTKDSSFTSYFQLELSHLLLKFLVHYNHAAK
jgi:hypothetical protein